jgi:hypothetical protein
LFKKTKYNIKKNYLTKFGISDEVASVDSTDSVPKGGNDNTGPLPTLTIAEEASTLRTMVSSKMSILSRPTSSPQKADLSFQDETELFSPDMDFDAPLESEPASRIATPEVVYKQSVTKQQQDNTRRKSSFTEAVTYEASETAVNEGASTVQTNTAPQRATYYAMNADALRGTGNNNQRLKISNTKTTILEEDTIL